MALACGRRVMAPVIAFLSFVDFGGGASSGGTEEAEPDLEQEVTPAVESCLDVSSDTSAD